jgi:hypothetical protein
VNLVQRPALRPSAVTPRLGRILARRPVRVVLAATVCAALGVVPAYAVWSVIGSGSTTATARILVTPAAPHVGSATVSSLVVSGTLPAGQVPSATYAVQRGSTTVCTPSLSPWSCTDTGLSASTAYGYTVVATVGSWAAASSPGAGTTLCDDPDSYAVGAPAMTAGTAATVTLTVTKCDGTVDTGYTGSKALTWAPVAASPTGKAAVLPATASFSAGTATVSVTPYAGGSAVLSVTTGAVTGSTTATVAAGVARNLVLSAVTSKLVAVTMTCQPLTEPSTARSCAAISPLQNGKHDWAATANLLDTWGNPATTPTAVTVTATRTGASSAATIPTGSGSTVTPLSISIANNEAPITITFTATGISTLTVTNAS